MASKTAKNVTMRTSLVARNVDFYSQLFAQEPARVETDYAKWMLEDPPVNFAISTRGGTPASDPATAAAGCCTPKANPSTRCC